MIEISKINLNYSESIVKGCTVLLGLVILHFLVCMIHKEKNKTNFKILSIKVFSVYMVNYTILVLSYFSLILILQTLIGFLDGISITYEINCSILYYFFNYISIYLILFPFYAFMLYEDKFKKDFNFMLYLYKVGVFLFLRIILLDFFPLEYQEIINVNLLSLLLYSFWGEIFLSSFFKVLTEIFCHLFFIGEKPTYLCHTLDEMDLMKTSDGTSTEVPVASPINPLPPVAFPINPLPPLDSPMNFLPADTPVNFLPSVDYPLDPLAARPKEN